MQRRHRDPYTRPMPSVAAASSSRAPSVDAIRHRFPALARPLAFLENAGGSQLPAEVIEAVRSYVTERYVQLGAGYGLSDEATATVDAAHQVVQRIMNGEGRGVTFLGPSTTQLCTMLAGRYAERLGPGDEIVLAEVGHEGNVGPWLTLERNGVTVRWWRVDPTAEDATLATLDQVLTPRTRLVAFPHVSNLLGRIVDVAEVTRRAHAVGARAVVDGVAFAPHRPIDVAAWDVDWYVYSTYKVYGPHMAALYGKREAIAELRAPNHFFIPPTQLPYAFELGGACHEGCAGIVALDRYLAFLAGAADGAGGDRATALRAFERMTELERPLQQALVAGLRSIPDVRLVGGAESGVSERVPTIGFLHARRTPAEVTKALHAAGIACRSGHMYSYRLCQALGIPVESGVVRLSAVHYNTIDEIERAVAAVRAL